MELQLVCYNLCYMYEKAVSCLCKLLALSSIEENWSKSLKYTNGVQQLTKTICYMRSTNMACQFSFCGHHRIGRAKIWNQCWFLWDGRNITGQNGCLKHCRQVRHHFILYTSYYFSQNGLQPKPLLNRTLAFLSKPNWYKLYAVI